MVDRNHVSRIRRRPNRPGVPGAADVGATAGDEHTHRRDDGTPRRPRGRGRDTRRRGAGETTAFDGAHAPPAVDDLPLMTSRDDEGVRRGPYEDAYEVWNGYTADPRYLDG